MRVLSLFQSFSILVVMSSSCSTTRAIRPWRHSEETNTDCYTQLSGEVRWYMFNIYKWKPPFFRDGQVLWIKMWANHNTLVCALSIAFTTSYHAGQLCTVLRQAWLPYDTKQTIKTLSFQTSFAFQLVERHPTRLPKRALYTHYQQPMFLYSSRHVYSSPRLGVTRILIKHCTRTISRCICRQAAHFNWYLCRRDGVPLAYAAVGPSGSERREE